MTYSRQLNVINFDVGYSDVCCRLYITQYAIRRPADRVANVVAKSRSVRHKSLFLAGLMAVMSALDSVMKSELIYQLFGKL